MEDLCLSYIQAILTLIHCRHSEMKFRIDRNGAQFTVLKYNA